MYVHVCRLDLARDLLVHDVHVVVVCVARMDGWIFRPGISRRDM